MLSMYVNKFDCLKQYMLYELIIYLACEIMINKFNKKQITKCQINGLEKTAMFASGM